LYEKGLSLREIELQTGHPKTSIREALIASGMSLRGAMEINIKGKGKGKPSLRRPTVCPYGYDWFDGKFVVVPAEYRVVTRILSLWQSGKSLHSIATYLNGQNITTRGGKRWFHTSVSQVIKRQSKKTERKEKYELR